MFSALKKLFRSTEPRQEPARNQSTQVIPVVVNLADEIRLGHEQVSLKQLRTALQSYAGQNVVLYYQREQPERPASLLAVNVVKAICDVGLPIAFPPEAKPAIDAIMQRVKSLESS